MAVVSFKLENWEKRRAAMQDVCSNCHATGWVENFYKQYENTVDLYNEKFAKPAKAIMDKLYAANKLTKTPFDEKIEWTYYELWHHQGRRARMGTAMMARTTRSGTASTRSRRRSIRNSFPKLRRFFPA